jgi:hypothetical protein
MLLLIARPRRFLPGNGRSRLGALMTVSASGRRFCSPSVLIREDLSVIVRRSPMENLPLVRVDLMAALAIEGYTTLISEKASPEVTAII